MILTLRHSPTDVNLFFNLEHGSCHIVSSYPFVFFTIKRSKTKPKKRTVNKNWGLSSIIANDGELGMDCENISLRSFLPPSLFRVEAVSEAKLIYILWWRMGTVAKAFYFPWFLFSTRSFGVISYYTRVNGPLSLQPFFSLQSEPCHHQHSNECCINSFIL